MTTLAKKVQRFLKSEDGPTAVEYAVMLLLILLVCIGSVAAFGSTTNAKFGQNSETINNAITMASGRAARSTSAYLR